MKKTILILLILLLINILNLYPVKKEYNFNSVRIDKDQYEINFDFESTLYENELIDVFYDAKEIKKYLNPILQVKETASTESTQDLEYVILVLFYKSTVIYKREIIKDQNEISFYISNFTQNVEIIPNIIESKGYFKVFMKDGKSIINYYQNYKLAKEFSNQYLSFSNMQAEAFCKSMCKYVRKLEADKLNNK